MIAALSALLFSLLQVGMPWPGPGTAHAAGGAQTVAYRSSTITTYASRTNTVVTAPAGIVDGDVLLIFMLTGVGGATPLTATAPTGFAVLTGFPQSKGDVPASFVVNCYCWYKIASSESGNYTVTHTAASSQAYMVAVSGAHQSGPFSPNPTLASGNSTPSTATGLTTPSNGSMVMFLEQDWGDTANNLVVPTGTTPTFTKRAGPTTNAGLMFAADGILATAGATGNKAITNNDNQSNSAWQAFLISIIPGP